MLTAAFVLMAETFIFLPSIANYRVSWLSERLTAAQLAALASEAFPGGQVPSALRAELLRTAQVKAVAIRRNGERRLVLPVEQGVSIDAHYDLRPDQGPAGASFPSHFRLRPQASRVRGDSSSFAALRKRPAAPNGRCSSSSRGPLDLPRLPSWT